VNQKELLSEANADEENMKIRLRFWQCCLSIAFVIAGGTTAFAVDPGQVLRAANLPQLIGPCCFSFNETVAVTEPAKPVPVVVTWSATTGFTSANEFVGLMVNGGPCRFYGSGSIPEQGNTQNTHTSLWVVLPSDGLIRGINTFTLCGGGADPSNGQNNLVVLDNTLTVRLSN